MIAEEEGQQAFSASLSQQIFIPASSSRIFTGKNKKIKTKLKQHLIPNVEAAGRESYLG